MRPLPAWPYVAGNGFWSPVTSTLNWCEEDYYATIYIAEIVNTLTNLAFVYLAYKGIASCVRNGHEPVFVVGFISYLFIGLGSFLFHATLKYSMQLLDELSMIYTTCIMFYAIFSHKRSTQACVLIALLAMTIAFSVTAYYHYLKDPLFHQNVFALLTAIVFFRSVWLMEAHLRPAKSTKSTGSSDSTKTTGVDGDPKTEQTRRRDFEILRVMWQVVAVGLGCLAIGFLLWNLDNMLCPLLRRWRHQVGLPWGILLEGHGWWHIFTGIAQYFNLTWSIWLRYCLDGRQDEVELVWPSLFASMPVVNRLGAGRAGGNSKKVI